MQEGRGVRQKAAGTWVARSCCLLAPGSHTIVPGTCIQGKVSGLEGKSRTSDNKRTRLTVLRVQHDLHGPRGRLRWQGCQGKGGALDDLPMCIAAHQACKSMQRVQECILRPLRDLEESGDDSWAAT